MVEDRKPGITHLLIILLVDMEHTEGYAKKYGENFSNAKIIGMSIVQKLLFLFLYSEELLPWKMSKIRTFDTECVH